MLFTAPSAEAGEDVHPQVLTPRWALARRAVFGSAGCSRHWQSNVPDRRFISRHTPLVCLAAAPEERERRLKLLNKSKIDDLSTSWTGIFIFIFLHYCVLYKLLYRVFTIL